MKTEQKKGWLQFILVVGFLVGAFALSFFLAYMREQPAAQPETGQLEILVTAKEFESQDLRIEFSATGTIELRARTSIVPPVSGEVVEINQNFYPSGNFEASEKLFQINPADYLNEVKRLNAEIARAQTKLRLQEAEAETALEEWKELNPDKETPSLVAKEPQLEEARATLTAAKAQLQTARNNLQRTSFTLPYAGRVIETNLELGQYVTTGQSLGEVYALQALEVHVPLDDKQTTWLLETEEPEIRVVADYLDKPQTYKAKLKRTAARRDSLTRFGNVVLEFIKPDERLIPGVFVEVFIKGPMKEDLWKLPLGALQEDDSVWIVDENNELVKLQPQILYIGQNHLLVKSNGKTERVIIGPLSGATEGTKVSTKEE